MTERVRTSKAAGPTPEVDDLQKELEGLKEWMSALGELVERERMLREQARDIATRDLELSAARQELHQHERGFADELEALVAAQLALAQLQERRAETVVATLAELAQREQGLVAREADVEAKARAVAEEAEAHAASAGDHDRQSAALAEREQALGVREAALEADGRESAAAAQQREAALAKREAAMAERKSELATETKAVSEAAREQSRSAEEVARQRLALDDREAKLGAREAELASREQAVAAERQLVEQQQAAFGARESELRAQERAAREAAAAQATWVSQREQEIETLREHERQIATRETTVARRETAVDNVRAAVVESTERQSKPSALWNLNVLERLVSERGGQFPARLDEWNAYLISLGDIADDAGGLPRSLDSLLDNVFAPFVGEKPTPPDLARS